VEFKASEKTTDEARVLTRIRAALEKDTRINLHRYPIAIQWQNGDIVLAGDVENIAAKKLALLTASEIPGVGKIIDRLKVIPRRADGGCRDPRSSI